MVTSTKELKQRLAAFLADPAQEGDFRVWFALALRDVHKSGDPALEGLAHDIMWAFYDQRNGLCTAEELTETLVELATDSAILYGAQQFAVQTGSSTHLQEAAGIVVQRVGIGPALEYA